MGEQEINLGEGLGDSCITVAGLFDPGRKETTSTTFFVTRKKKLPEGRGVRVEGKGVGSAAVFGACHTGGEDTIFIGRKATWGPRKEGGGSEGGKVEHV